MQNYCQCKDVTVFDHIMVFCTSLYVLFDHDRTNDTLSNQIGNIPYIGKIWLDTNKSVVEFTLELLVISDLFSESECCSGDELEYFYDDQRKAINCNDKHNCFIFWLTPLLAYNNECLDGLKQSIINYMWACGIPLVWNKSFNCSLH